jgi:hypothetical protein
MTRKRSIPGFMKKPNESLPASSRFSNRGGEENAVDFRSASRVFRARKGAILCRLLLALMVLPVVFFGIGLVGTMAGLGLVIFAAGALAGLAQAIYRWLCRIAVSPEGVKARTPFGESELHFTEVDRWSVNRGDDHGKSLWKRNPVVLQSNYAVHFCRRGETRITRIHDWELADPGWSEFIEALRSHLGGRESEPGVRPG